MGRQRRGRHMLRPTLLLLVHQGDTHGYDLLDKLKDFGLEGIDPSLIYRALRDMEMDGLISSTWDAQETQGPPRRIYSLTEQGNLVLQQYLDELQVTRSRIDQLLDAYTSHMRDGKGSFHNHEKGDHNA